MSDATTTAPKVLFEITEDKLNTGLRGFPIGTCRTSAVSPTLGMTYVGYTLEQLKDKSAEEVIYLILNKELPNEEQTEAFKAEMAKRSEIDPKVYEALKALPKEGHPMEWLITGLSLLGMTGKSE